MIGVSAEKFEVERVSEREEQRDKSRREEKRAIVLNWSL